MPNKKSAIRLSTNILNYFAAFTETRFNFRTLISYRWTSNELTLDLGIFQAFQNILLQRIKTGDSTPLTAKNNEYVLSLSGDDILLEIHTALSDKFGLKYLKKYIEQEIQKVAERDAVFIATEKGLQAADNANLSEQEVKNQNSQTFHDGRRKYNLALRKQIEVIIVELQRKQIDRLKDELGIEHVPASTFNPANYLKKHFDALQSIARDTGFKNPCLSAPVSTRSSFNNEKPSGGCHRQPLGFGEILSHVRRLYKKSGISRCGKSTKRNQFYDHIDLLFEKKPRSVDFLIKF